MKKTEIEIPPNMSEAEKIEYLKMAAEYWKNYYLRLCRILEKKDPSTSLRMTGSVVGKKLEKKNEAGKIQRRAEGEYDF